MNLFKTNLPTHYPKTIHQKFTIDSMKHLFSLLALILVISCSSGTTENLAERVDQLIAEDNYVEALDLINSADPAETEADLQTLREKTHLNYGIYLEYRGPEDSSMRDRMISALEQYIAVLKINPNNQKAVSEIEQIMSIYSTMPDRSPGEDIVQELNELGFDY